MRDNWNLRVTGPRVVLMPYLRSFVPKYHEWMQDEYILQMTGSEPLSLEEEFDMQRQWRVDKEKCTFIVHTREQEDGAHVMIGDINLFLSSTYSDEDEDGLRPIPTGEINVMIAEAAYRGRGLAKEAVLLMMHYGSRCLGLSKFMCKIHESNTASIQMFKKLGFKEVKYVRAFEEYQLDLSVDAHEGLPQEIVDSAAGDFRAFIDAVLGYHGITSIEWEARDAFGETEDAGDEVSPKQEYKREFAFARK